VTPVARRSTPPDPDHERCAHHPLTMAVPGRDEVQLEFVARTPHAKVFTRCSWPQRFVQGHDAAVGSEPPA